MYTEHAPLSRTCSAKSFTLSTRDVMFVKMWFAGQRSDVLMLKSHQTAADTGGTKGRSGQVEMSEVFASIRHGAGHHAGAG